MQIYHKIYDKDNKAISNGVIRTSMNYYLFYYIKYRTKL